MDLRTIKGLIIDMDGVLWRGDQPLLDLPAFFEAIRNLGLRVVLATNNSTRSVAQYLEKLSGYGAHLRAENIATSSMAAGSYLKAKYPQGGAVFVVGEAGLAETLREFGFEHAEKDVVAVVAGLDRSLSYAKLTRAVQLIRAGAEFVGTNPDLTFPSPGGLTPGTGALLAFLEAASGQKPSVMGKPEPYLYDLAIRRMEAAPEKVLVIGDRLDTDILGAQRMGCPTALVLTGVSTPQEADQWRPQPDLVCQNVAEIVAKFTEVRYH